MLRNYLVVSLRSLLRHKLHTSVNILGLGVGLACCALILLYVRHELSYDRFFPEVQRTYRVVDELEIPARDVRARTALTPFPMARALEDELPEVERATRVSLWENARTLVGHGGRWLYEDRMLYADSSLLQVLAYPIRDGDPNAALDDPGSVVLTAATARRHFGDEPAVGRALTIDGEDRQVTAVLKELPAPSHMRFDLIVPFGDLARQFGDDTESNWVNHSFFTYLRLREGASAESLGARLPAFVADRAREQAQQMGARITPRLQPVTCIHLRSDLQYELGSNGDIHRVYAFCAVGVLVLLIACFNFVNLAAARLSGRTREVGVRKAVGALRVQLVRQFLTETALTGFAALGLAAALIEAAHPLFSTVTGIALLPVGGGLWTVLIVLSTIVTLAAGSYPALVFSTCQPTAALRGAVAGAPASRLHRGLVIAQFAAAAFLLASTGVVRTQVSYLNSRGLGFDRDGVIVLPLPDGGRDHLDALRSSLASVSGVEAVSATSSVPSRMTSQHGVRPEGSDDVVTTYMVFTDFDFVQTLGLTVAEGRSFSRDLGADVQGAFMVNRAALESFGWDSIEGRTLEWMHLGGQGEAILEAPVVGLVDDFHFRSLRHAIEPLVIQLTTGTGHLDFIAVRINAASGATVRRDLEQAWHRVLGSHPFEYAYLDEQLAALYGDEERTGWIVGGFSVVAAVVACLGLFALAAEATRRRTREVGIRKALGATATRIVALLSIEFLKLALLANLIAWPIAWWATNTWLQGFAYRIEAGPGLYMLASLTTLSFAWLAVAWQTVHAARTNPVDALRQE